MATIGWPSELRRGLGWLSTRRSLLPAIQAMRELLPGDPSFGDPMSTTGNDPARVLARRAWAGNESPWSALSELGLAVLQVADWAGADLRPGQRDEVVKRLGDGTMAVFADAGCALLAAEACMGEIGEAKCDGYEPQMRAGLHFGTPQPIGIDYLGVDVNIAARLCEAARGNEVLISDAVRSHLHRRKGLRRPPRRELDGVPKGLEIYSVAVDGAAS
jgi:adenylate cyclase